MANELRKTGISIVGDIPWGTHFCSFYGTTQDLLDILVPYFKAGLENNEFGLWVISNSELLTVQDAISALRKAVPDLDRHVAERSIEVVRHDAWFLQAGAFDFSRVVNRFKEQLDEALARGYLGMRTNGSPAWLQNTHELRAFEQALDSLFLNERMVASCTYPLAESGAANLLDVARTHQFAIARRQGNWEIVETPELRQAKAEALLHAREQEFRAFVENATDQIIRYDKEFRRTYVNPAVIAAYGLPKEAFIGKPVGSFVEDAGLETDIDEVTAIRRQIKSVFDTGKATEFEVTFPSPGGRRTYWTRMFPEFDPNGVVINVLAISREITERKQAEAAIRSLLQISEKLHATLDIDALLDSLVIEAMELIDAESGWSGLRTEEGMVCHTHITRDLQVVPFEYFWPPGVGLPGWVLVYKVPYVMNDAQSDKVIIPEIRERFGVNTAIDTPILDAQGEVIGFFEVNNKKNGARFSESDVEKLVAVSRIASIALQNAMSYRNLERAEKARRESQLQLQLLSRQLLQAQEAERRSIARELHDEIGQRLTGLGLLLSSQHPSPDQLADAQAVVRDLIAQVRSLALDLRPAMLDDLGLIPALVWLFERYTAQTHVAVRFEHAGLEEQRFAPEVETTAYRIVQEALTNIARHAGVSEVTVRLWTDDDTLSVITVDRGRGFDLQTVRTTLSSGLAGMAERAALLGGSLTIESAPATGTRVTASLPLHSDGEPRGQEQDA